MATDSEELTEEQLWAEEDKYAIYKMKHVMGTKDYPSGVAVTTNWSDQGLEKALNRHLKHAKNCSKTGNRAELYIVMCAEPELYVAEKMVSYPTLKDCLEHLAMVYRWEQHRPTFLVPDTQMTKVMQLVTM